MTNQHPITVPLNLIEDWRLAPEFCDGKKKSVMVTVSRERMQYIADQAAQWGANQESDACCEWLQDPDLNVDTYKLRTDRRPKPPSLKEQALDSWDRLRNEAWCQEIDLDLDTIRRALEQLDD